MTANELRTLPQDKRYHFTLYYGEKKFGHAEEHDNRFYLVHRTSSNRDLPVEEIGTLVLPEQIIDCSPWDGKPFFSEDTSFSYDGGHHYETMVILGAGASFDYSYDKELKNRPPLCKDLFCHDYSDLIQRFAGVENLCSQLRQAPDVEEYFQRQWQKVTATYNPQALKKLIDVQFYLHYLFGGISAQPDFSYNNYSAFFQHLYDHLVAKGVHQKALVVTFNYDTLLERSLRRSLDYSYSVVDQYMDMSRRFLLFKPHGSWNWIRKIDDAFCQTLDPSREPIMDRLHESLYNNEISLGHLMPHLSSEISILPDHNMWNNYYFPQLLVPYKRKDAFVMPGKHSTMLETFLPQVKRIFIIGWKGAEPQFKALLWKTLGNNEIQVIYANHKEDGVVAELSAVLPNAHFSKVTVPADNEATFTGLNQAIEQADKFFE